MRLKTAGYCSGPRLAVVEKDACFPAEFETLLLSDESAVLQPDGTELNPAEGLDFWRETFNSGDIIVINEYGVISRLFDSSEGDATIYLTGVCNSNCIMCPTSDYERKNYRGMSDQWMMRYVEMLPADAGHISVTGGEPTMRTELFFQIMALLAERFQEIEVLLLTNGRSFASREMTSRLMKKCPAYLKAAVPVHGPDAKLHDSITQAPGSFRQTKAGIRHLLANGIAVEIRIVVSALNLRSLSETAAMIVESFPDVSIVNFVGLETLGNCAKNLSRVYVDYRESFRYIKPAVDLLAAAGVNVSLYNYPLCTVERGYWGLCRKSITPSKVRFAEDCARCAVRPICGGYFESTLAVAKPQVQPIFRL